MVPNSFAPRRRVALWSVREQTANLRMKGACAVAGEAPDLKGMLQKTEEVTYGAYE